MSHGFLDVDVERRECQHLTHCAFTQGLLLHAYDMSGIIQGGDGVGGKP